jgi:hypothetical protein
MGWKHLEGFTQAWPSLSFGLSRNIVLSCGEVRQRQWLRRAWDTADIDSGIVIEVVIRGDQGIASSILETDSIAIVDAVEVLDGSNDRLSSVVGIDYYSQWDARSRLGPFVEQQLKGY